VINKADQPHSQSGRKKKSRWAENGSSSENIEKGGLRGFGRLEGGRKSDNRAVDGYLQSVGETRRDDPGGGRGLLA